MICRKIYSFLLLPANKGKGKFCMEEKEKKTQRKRNGIYSIKTRIVAIVIGAVLLAAVLNLWVVIPIMRDNMTSTNKNYIFDVATASGYTVDMLYLNYGEDMYSSGALEKVLGGVGISGVFSSYAYLVDRDGTMRYHPTASKIGQPVENAVVSGVVSELQQGRIPAAKVVEYEFNGTIKLAGYYVNEGGDYIVVVTADKDEVLEPMQEMIRKCVIGSLLVLIICAVFGFVAALRIIKPIRGITELVKKLEHLDFTKGEQQDKLNRRKDETGDMSRALSKLREKLAEVVGALQQQSTSIMQAAEALDRNAGETIRSVGQVEQAVGDIATGATSQADETQTATENVVAMGDMINTTSGEVSMLNAKTKEISESSDAATRILGELGEINQKAVESVELIAQQTNTTNESAQKIHEATTLISNIAEETNLLSLNASIEAARAGEQGRGFAVVAAQIQKLAEQSNQSASQIEQIITSLLGDTAKAVGTMNEVKDIMAKQNEKVVSASSTFDKVKREIDESIRSISQIAGATEQMQAARSNVVDVVQNLTAIAEENAASTEETSASVTEIAAIIEDIANNAASLKDIVEELELNMAQFKL